MFFAGLVFLSALASVNLLSAAPLSCISINNQECKVRAQIMNVNIEEPVFFPSVLKQVNSVVLVIISMTHMQNCVFLML